MKIVAIAAVLAITAPAAAWAQPSATSDSVSVVARTGHRIATVGPDATGLYTLRVNVSDLDASSEAGWQAMQARVARGAATLCEVSAEGPRTDGFYDAGRSQCLKQTQAAAQTQLERVRDAVRTGHPVASVDFGTRLAVR